MLQPIAGSGLDGAQHAKAWEEYKTYGTAGKNEDEIEEKTASDRRFTREEEEEEEEEDQRKNKIVPKEQLIKQKSYGTIGKRVWDKKAHGGNITSPPERKRKATTLWSKHRTGRLLSENPGTKNRRAARRQILWVII